MIRVGGDSFELDLESATTVQQLRAPIEELTGVSPSIQQYVHDGLLLHDDAALGGMADEDFLQLTLIVSRPSLVLTGSRDGSARLWDMRTSTSTVVANHQGEVNTAEISPRGTSVLTSSDDRTAKIWRLDDDGEWATWATTTFKSHDDRRGVFSGTFSSDRSCVLTAGEDGCVKIWSVGSGKRKQAFIPLHRGKVNSAVFSPCGSFVLSASDDRTSKLWNIESGLCVQTFEGHTSGLAHASFAPFLNGVSVVTASYDRTAKLWDPTDGRCLATFVGHRGVVSSAVVSPDLASLLTGSHDCTAKLWSVENGTCVRTFEGHSDIVNCAVFSPDGESVLTASDDCTWRVWGTESCESMGIFAGHTKGVTSVQMMQ